jgi:hypothetical protein
VWVGKSKKLKRVSGSLDEQQYPLHVEDGVAGKSYCDNPDEAAAPEGGGSFAEYAMISLHRLRIFLDETYEMIIDRLEMMPPILEIVGLESDDLQDPCTLNKWFDRIAMEL